PPSSWNIPWARAPSTMASPSTIRPKTSRSGSTSTTAPRSFSTWGYWAAMNSKRTLAAVAFAALAVSCVERQGPKPPTFPSGGLLARSTPLQQPQMLSALEGIYDTTNRFGTFAVVHASMQGSSAATMRPALAILGRNHFAFAILEPGCFTDSSSGTPTVQLVL